MITFKQVVINRNYVLMYLLMCGHSIPVSKLDYEKGAAAIKGEKIECLQCKYETKREIQIRQEEREACVRLLAVENGVIGRGALISRLGAIKIIEEKL